MPFLPHISSHMYVLWSRLYTWHFKEPRKSLYMWLYQATYHLLYRKITYIIILHVNIRKASAYNPTHSARVVHLRTSFKNPPSQMVNRAHLCLKKLKCQFWQIICCTKIIFCSHGIQFSCADYIFNEIFYISLPKYHPQKILRKEKDI